MANFKYTSFSDVYTSFLSKITDDMYMELTPEDTYKILRQLLLSALSKFEFPRQSLDFQLIQRKKIDSEDDQIQIEWAFVNRLTGEEINIISTYMIVEWIGQQLASVENVRMKYSGSDFKFTSQANHMQKLLQLKKDYEREGFHLQRLYKRRKTDKNGIYRSTFGQIMEKPAYYNTNSNNGEERYERHVAKRNFTLVRGDTFTFDLLLSDLKDFTVEGLFFSVKVTEDDNYYVFQKNLENNGIEEIQPLRYRIRIAPEDTQDLNPGIYYYDLQVNLGSDVYTILIGCLNIKQDITFH